MNFSGITNSTFGDSSQSDYVNWSTVSSGVLQSTMSTAAELVCSSGRTPCANLDYCFNDGLCCEHHGQEQCVCPTGYRGSRCERKVDDDSLVKFLEAVKSRDEHAVKAGVASIISMTIGLLALAACIILVILLVRRKMLVKRSGDLEKHLSDIQQELNSMPTISKMIQLTRLSRMFQQSARVAIETTVLSADVRRLIHDPSPQDACLPRWSSAPASLCPLSPVHQTAAGDEVDVGVSPTLVEPTVKRKLLQMFSLDDRALDRAQQQQLHGDNATTTQL